MDRTSKKRTTLRRVIDIAKAVFRRHGHDRLPTTTVRLHVADLPAVLRLTFPELGRILNEITQEANGAIRVGAVNDGSPRVRNNYWPIEVSRTALAGDVIPATSLSIVLNNRQWCIEVPGRLDLIPIARQGTLKGELVAIIAERRLGQTQSLEHVLEGLNERVTDPRTQRPSPKQLDYALREINETLHTRGLRRLRRIGTRGGDIGVLWRKQPIYGVELVMEMRRGQMRVGFIVDPSPLRRR